MTHSHLPLIAADYYGHSILPLWWSVPPQESGLDSPDKGIYCFCSFCLTHSQTSHNCVGKWNWPSGAHNVNFHFYPEWLENRGSCYQQKKVGTAAANIWRNSGPKTMYGSYGAPFTNQDWGHAERTKTHFLAKQTHVLSSRWCTDQADTGTFVSGANYVCGRQHKPESTWDRFKKKRGEHCLGNILACTFPADPLFLSSNIAQGYVFSFLRMSLSRGRRGASQDVRVCSKHWHGNLPVLCTGYGDMDSDPLISIMCEYVHILMQLRPDFFLLHCQLGRTMTCSGLQCRYILELKTLCMAHEIRISFR